MIGPRAVVIALFGLYRCFRFWLPPKQRPSALPYNYADEIHNDFVHAASILRAQIFKIDMNISRDGVRAIGQTMELDVRVIIPADDEEGLHQQETDPDCCQVDIANLRARLLQLDSLNEVILNELIFEKDDDTNYHMKFITAVANLRSLNYGIPVADTMQVRQIAGRIIPAMATTTSVASGLACIELIKMALSDGCMENLRNCFFSLHGPKFRFMKPEVPSVTEYPGGKFTVWDRLVLQAPKTLQECLDEIEVSL